MGERLPTGNQLCLTKKKDMKKKHYEILVGGDGFGNYPDRYVDVYCTEDELNTVATALVGYVRSFTHGGCCCVAKEGGGVSHSHFDIMFADCM